jgi:hypothetical protein
LESDSVCCTNVSRLHFFDTGTGTESKLHKHSAFAWWRGAPFVGRQMTWQEDCRAKGGMVTVMPTPGNYVPACRLSNGDGTSTYVDMRNWDEQIADAESMWQDEWDIALGKAVTVRDEIVDKTKNILGFSFGAVAAVGLFALWFMLPRKR